MDFPGSMKAASRRPCKCSKCCCVGITVLVIIIVILAVGLPLIYKVYKPRDPTIRIVSMKIEQPSGGDVLPSTLVATTDADVTNPNALAVHFESPKVTAYFHNQQVAHAQVPPGVAPAHGKVIFKSKMSLNLTELLDNEQFVDEFMKGEVGLNITVPVSGKVEILGIIPHHIDLQFNCTLKIDVATFALKNQSCTEQMWIWKPRPKY